MCGGSSSDRPGVGVERFFDRAQRWGPSVSIGALAIALGAQKIRSFDYWWQLRTGQLIAETGAVPRVDVFSYSVAGEPYLDIHWLHQLGLHALYGFGGHAGVVAGKIVLVLLLSGFVAAIGWRRDRVWVTALGVGAMLLVASDRLMPRPELPSFVLLAAMLWLLDRDERKGDYWLFAIVPLEILWANLHGLFALGVALCGIALAGELLRPLLVPDTALRTRRVLRLGGLSALVVLATLVNPNMVEGALYPLRQLGMIGTAETRGLFGEWIQELQPTLGGALALPPLALALPTLLACASFLAMALHWRRFEARDPLLWVAFGYLALSAHRNLALFGIVAATIWARNLNAFLDARPRSPRVARLAAGVVTAIIVLASVDVATSRFFSRIGSFREAGFGPLELLYPVGAAEWIARERPPGRIAHHMADGGYLVWRLWPDYRVLVDGRLEVYGEERFAHLQLLSPEQFRALDDEYSFGSVLLHYSLVDSAALLSWLQLNSGWRLVYVDDAAALFVRVSPETHHHLEVDLDAPELFPPLPAGSRIGDQMRRLARTTFFRAMRRPKRALAVWKESVEIHPDLEDADRMLAELLAETGRDADAAEIIEKLVAERPDDVALMVKLGDLRFETDRAEARRWFDLALERAPDVPYVMLRRGDIAELDGDRAQAMRLYGKVLTIVPEADPIARRARRALERIGAAFESPTGSL